MQTTTKIQSKEDYIEAAKVLISNNTDYKKYMVADEMLREVSNAPIGWIIAKELISNPVDDMGVCLVVSKLMRNKVACFLSQLPPTDYMPLFEILLSKFQVGRRITVLLNF